MQRRKSKRSLRNSSRRQKKKSCDLVDRISDLPGSILGLILSLLPTKEAVATSILSQRWKIAWVTVHNLDFCYHGYGKYNKDENVRFVRFVNRVLLLHDTRLLNKFCLHWKPYCVSSQVTSWISTVISKNVHELSLCLEMDMPISVFNCDSLRSLKLDGCISVSSATVFCLPKLEILELVEVYFESEETFEKLINGCSMLDDLFINTEGGGFTYRIFSTSLRRLYYMSDCDLKLEASSLEYLNLSGFMDEILVPKNLSSLVEADIRIGYDFYEADACNSIVEVVRASDCAKFLTLSDDVMRALRCATISLSTKFRRLVKLETEIECCPWSSLRDFIQNSDNLDDLTIYQYPYDENNHDHSKWTTPVAVPRCLSNSLKKVYITGYKGLEDEREMIRYMLKHGSVLEVMHISFFYEVSDGDRVELRQKMHESPKKSLACELRL